MVATPGARPVWDKTHEEASLVEDVNELTDIWHMQSKAAWPVSYVLLFFFWLRGNAHGVGAFLFLVRVILSCSEQLINLLLLSICLGSRSTTPIFSLAFLRLLTRQSSVPRSTSKDGQSNPYHPIPPRSPFWSSRTLGDGQAREAYRKSCWEHWQVLVTSPSNMVVPPCVPGWAELNPLLHDTMWNQRRLDLNTSLRKRGVLHHPVSPHHSRPLRHC